MLFNASIIEKFLKRAVVKIAQMKKYITFSEAVKMNVMLAMNVVIFGDLDPV